MGSKNVKLKEIFLDHYKYLGKRRNSLKIYDSPPRNMILSPFNLSFNAIDKLLVVNFEDDPIYYRIELQIIRVIDTDYPLVVLYRKDNMVDVYYSNEAVIINRKKILADLHIDISFNKLETIDFKFLFDDTGLNASLFLEDKLENDIELEIKENIPERKLASILAPMVAISKKPESFPIVFLDRFGMVLIENTEIYVKINDIARNVVEMPVKINGMPVYAAHYSLNPVMSAWNSTFSGNLDPIIFTKTSLQVTEENLDIYLHNNSEYFEIKLIFGRDERNRKLSFEFSPAIPNLLSLNNNSKIIGRFSCIIDEQKGIFGGEYYLTRIGNTIELNITPSKGRQPFPGKLWLKNYKWTSLLEIQIDGNITIDSSWRRTSG
jgi:hypothetical protein